MYLMEPEDDSLFIKSFTVELMPKPGPRRIGVKVTYGLSKRISLGEGKPATSVLVKEGTFTLPIHSHEELELFVSEKEKEIFENIYTMTARIKDNLIELIQQNMEAQTFEQKTSKTDD